jgi:hypothetical protein
MVTTELTGHSAWALRRVLRAALGCTAGLWVITALAVIAGAADPGIALMRSPHPALHPSVEAWASILATNSRVLCAPLLLAAVGVQHHRWGRRLGDLSVFALLTLNGGLVGVELGRWGTQLLPYLPQLPLEWLAAGASAGGWVIARRASGGSTDRRALLLTALLAAGLLAAAAAVEVLLTPHATGSAA